MQNISGHPTPVSQKILRGLSFLSLAYLAYVMCAFVYTLNKHSLGIEENLVFVMIAASFAALFLFTAVRQLFAQRRRLILIITGAVMCCNIGQVIYMRMVEDRIDQIASEHAVEGFAYPDPIFPISMYLVLCAVWYIPLIFPWIANFRRQEMLSSIVD